MDLIKINSGQKLCVDLIDYICTWEQEDDNKCPAYKYDLGIKIIESKIDKNGQQRISGKFKTYCPICGRVHDAVRERCELEFKNSACPEGHKNLQARVSRIKRKVERTDSLNEETYEFVVDLVCLDCRKEIRRFKNRFKGVIASIKKISIGIKGLEIESK